MRTTRTPKTSVRTNTMDDVKTPTGGSMGLQVERGVVTTRLQLLKPTPGERRTCVKFKENENTPLALVVAVETTTAPHCSCTRASRSKHNKTIVRLKYLNS